MPAYDDREELAPRDIVARAIDDQMKKRGEEHVWLDISHKPAEAVLGHFPNIQETLLKHGLDLTAGPIPVVPAAHYTCGGVVVDRVGQTSIAGLFACGEVTCSGLHGANRLASNSILEALVYAHNAVGPATAYAAEHGHQDRIPDWDESNVENPSEWILVSHNREELRRVMQGYVGIVRSQLRSGARGPADRPDPPGDRGLLPADAALGRAVRAAQPGRRRPPGRVVRPASPRESRLALHGGLPGDRPGSAPRHVDQRAGDGLLTVLG